MSADLHVTHHLHGVKLGPKLGPFPVVVWVLIIGAGLYVAHRRAASLSSSSTTDTTSTDTTSTDTSSVPADASSSVPLNPVGTGGAVSNDGAPVSSFNPVAVTDNGTWTQAAITALVKAGITPITANNAIDRYLTGDPLTTDEAHAVNVAIGLVGPPPEGAPPVTVMSAPASSTPAAPRPTTAPKASRPPATSSHPAASHAAPRPSRGGRYTVKSGDTLYAIAASHHVAEPALYSLNRPTIEAAAKRHGKSSSESGHWIYPGTVLVLP